MTRVNAVLYRSDSEDNRLRRMEGKSDIHANGKLKLKTSLEALLLIVLKRPRHNSHYFLIVGQYLRRAVGIFQDVSILRWRTVTGLPSARLDLERTCRH